MRLNHYLARCGVASRRGAEKLILAGDVSVNGVVTRALATQVRTGHDRVEVRGKPVTPPSRRLYLMLNKPAGFDVTRRDRHAPRTVFDLLPGDLPPSVQPVGRLDRATTGLLLLTNDGDLGFRLTHPRYQVEKEYIARGAAAASDDQIARLLSGIDLEDGFAKAAGVKRIGSKNDRARGAARQKGLSIVMHQGRKRIVRRLCKAVGYPLQELHRTRVGPLELGDLATGHWRELGPEEIEKLYRAAGLPFSHDEE